MIFFSRHLTSFPYLLILSMKFRKIPALTDNSLETLSEQGQCT